MSSFLRKKLVFQMMIYQIFKIVFSNAHMVVLENFVFKIMVSYHILKIIV